LKDLYQVFLNSSSVELAFSKLPDSIDKDGYSEFRYTARLVDVFMRKFSDGSDEFIFTFEITT
jgi:hypothetical protein